MKKPWLGHNSEPDNAYKTNLMNLSWALIFFSYNFIYDYFVQILHFSLYPMIRNVHKFKHILVDFFRNVHHLKSFSPKTIYLSWNKLNVNS